MARILTIDARRIRFRQIALSSDRFGGPTFVATWNKTISRKKTAAEAPFAKAAFDAAWTGDPIENRRSVSRTRIAENRRSLPTDS